MGLRRPSCTDKERGSAPTERCPPRSVSSSSNGATRHMIVIGADTHKRNHTLVAVDGQTGAARGQLQIAASDAGALAALRFAAGLDEERGWAVRGWRRVCAGLEAEL